MRILLDRITHGRVTGWLTGGIALKAACGLALLVGLGLLMSKREAQDLRLVYFRLLLFLTEVNLMEFYFQQFSAIVPASLKFAAFLLLLDYRKRFVPCGSGD